MILQLNSYLHKITKRDHNTKTIKRNLNCNIYFANQKEEEEENENKKKRKKKLISSFLNILYNIA